MRSRQEYVEGLKDGRQVFYRGSSVDVTSHPVLKMAVEHASKLFEYSGRSDSGSSRSKFFKVPANGDDLLVRHRLIYGLTMFCSGVFNISQAIGSDALFALAATTKRMDREKGTDYGRRVEGYLEYVAGKDLTLATAQTDVKGDRSKRPKEQIDPDMYLRVVEVRGDGLVVRGAKAHTTQGAVSDEIVVLPTRAMRDSEKEYAVAFAVPANTRGLKMFLRPIDELEGNSSVVLSRFDYELENLTVFDDVFVPWDRVFLFEEPAYAGRLASLFATFHRFTALSYRAATANLFIGAARLAAYVNGVLNEKHVRDDLVDMALYKEVLRAAALSAAVTCVVEEGVAIPNPVFTNTGKLFSNTRFHKLVSGLIDISGGIVATIPSQEDFDGEERGLIYKYLRGAVGGEERAAVLRLAKELGSSSLTGYLLTLMIHAEGSIEASKIEMYRSYDWSEAEGLAKSILDRRRAE